MNKNIQLIKPKERAKSTINYNNFIMQPKVAAIEKQSW